MTWKERSLIVGVTLLMIATIGAAVGAGAEALRLLFGGW